MADYMQELAQLQAVVEATNANAARSARSSQSSSREPSPNRSPADGAYGGSTDVVMARFNVGGRLARFRQANNERRMTAPAAGTVGAPPARNGRLYGEVGPPQPG